MSTEEREATILPVQLEGNFRRLFSTGEVWGAGVVEMDPDINKTNFPETNRGNWRESLLLVSFHRPIGDDEDPEKSELLLELNKMGLQPEGAQGLMAVAESYQGLVWGCPIIARRQVWRNQSGHLMCPALVLHEHECEMYLYKIAACLGAHTLFLASPKRGIDRRSK